MPPKDGIVSIQEVTMGESKRACFTTVTVLLSGIIILFGSGPIYMDVVRAALVIAFATFIASSKGVRWISLKTAGLLLLATSFTIAVSGYVGETYEFFGAGVMLIVLILSLFCLAYVGRKRTTPGT